MAKRLIKEDIISHDRWMVSYADFLTLLLAFFVVMYSVSQLNEAKFKVLSETLDDAFNVPEKSLAPIQVGEPVTAVMPGVVEDALESPEQKPASGHVDEDQPKATTSEPQLPEEFKKISQRVEEQFKDLVDRNLVSVQGNEEWLEIELKSSLLFSSGEATASADADPIIAQMAGIVKDSKLPIRVEGFTDNEPIDNDIFPSNWELSSARAASIVKLLVDNGVSATRLAAVGYGEFQPVASNDIESGRAANRRVVLMISRNALLRPALLRAEATELPAATSVPEPAPGDALQALDVGAAPAAVTPEAQVLEEQLAAPSAADVIAPQVPTPQTGVVRIDLPGGGVLFTNDPARGQADDSIPGTTDQPAVNTPPLQQ